ncbi:hypothetical protein, partial [Plasmodium yoelii yoelii]
MRRQVAVGLRDDGGGPCFVSVSEQHGVDEGTSAAFQSDDGAVRDAGSAVEHGLYVFRKYVFSSRPQDHVALPAVDVQEAVGIEAAGVAGFQPAVGESRFGAPAPTIFLRRPDPAGHRRTRWSARSRKSGRGSCRAAEATGSRGSCRCGIPAGPSWVLRNF